MTMILIRALVAPPPPPPSPDLIFKNQATSDKDKPPGQFVNDLLRTEFHKWVHHHPHCLSLYFARAHHLYELGSSCLGSSNSVYRSTRHVCIRVHTRFTMSTAHRVFVFLRLCEASSDLEGTCLRLAMYSTRCSSNLLA